ncbi:MAG: LCP family protein [Clostridia bacterium]|nr:LCP family protein [Clostridia bacterium]
MTNKNTNKKERLVETLVILFFTLVAIGIGVGIAAGNFSPAPPDVDEEIPFHTGDVETDLENLGQEDQADKQEDKYVRKEGVYNFMFVGYDKAAGLTDVIMLAQFDTNTGGINIIQIPRDTYARYNEGGYYRKINGALSYFKRDLDDLASFFETNLCINIDFYGSIDLVAFRNIVDIIGGVYIDVPEDMEYDDPAQGLYINIKKGPQVLDGKTAEGFVRFRSGYVTADIGRTDAQKLFMTAFMKQFKSKVSVSTLAQIGTQILKYVNTNLTLNEFVYFATKVLDIDLDKLTMMTLPGVSAREYGSSGTWYYVLSRSSMLSVVNEYLNVYSRDIPDSIFDPNRVFTNESADHLNKIYLSDGNTSIYVGDEVDENGIHIPRTEKHNTPQAQPTVDTPSENPEDTDTESQDTIDEPTLEENVPEENNPEDTEEIIE